MCAARFRRFSFGLGAQESPIGRLSADWRLLRAPIASDITQLIEIQAKRPPPRTATGDRRLAARDSQLAAAGRKIDTRAFSFTLDCADRPTGGGRSGGATAEMNFIFSVRPRRRRLVSRTHARARIVGGQRRVYVD